MHPTNQSSHPLTDILVCGLRLDRAALDEALGYLKASADDNEVGRIGHPFRVTCHGLGFLALTCCATALLQIGLLNQLRVEGSDEVVPGQSVRPHLLTSVLSIDLSV